MFCKNCGMELPEEAKFCMSCGKKTESDNTTINMNKFRNEINKKDKFFDDIDDEIIEIKKVTIKKDSCIDEIIINKNRSIQKNKNHTKLRSVYKDLDDEDVEEMIIKNNFFDSELNQNGSFVNDYLEDTINGDKVIIDRATNLMWHQSGSNDVMILSKTNKWLKELNQNNYAGFNDWRLPTLEEASSLIENELNEDSLFIDERFSKEQKWVLTGDTLSFGVTWYILFDFGKVSWLSTSKRSCYVRPMRSR